MPSLPVDPTSPATTTPPPPPPSLDSGAPTDTAPTGDTGPALVAGDPLTVDVTGWVYAADAGAATWVQPAGLGSLLAALATGTQVLIGPLAVGPTDATLRLALGSHDAQSPCNQTADLSGPWTDPSFATAAPTLVLTVAEVDVTLTDVAFAGTFFPDGTSIGQGTLSGTIDTRTLGPAFGVGSAPEAVCDLAASFGGTCLACADGEPYCLDVEVDDLSALVVPDGEIRERTADQIAADPRCG
jgi:hypothetical protein